MRFLIFIIILVVLDVHYLVAQKNNTYDFESEYQRIVSLMPYEDIDTLYKEIEIFDKNAIKKKNKKYIGKAKFLYGAYYTVMINDHINAYNNFIQSLKVFEELNLTEEIATVRNQMGLINYMLKNSDQALIDLENSYKIAISNPTERNKKTAAIALYLTAHTLIELKQFDEAKRNLDLAENLHREIQNEKGLKECLITNGIIDLEKGRIDSAIVKIEHYLSWTSDKYALGLGAPYLARAYLKKGELNKAEQVAKNSLMVSKEIKKNNWILNSLEVYRDVLFEKKNYKKAAEISKEFELLKDSIFNTNRLFKTAVLKFNYDTEKKNLEEAITSAKKEEVQKATLGRQKLLTNVFLITSVIVLILVLGIFHQYRQKENKNKELAIALMDLKKTQDQLVLKEKLASLGQLTAGIAHEIQNPLNFVNNFAQVSFEMAEEAEQVSNLQEAKDYIHDIKGNLSKVNFHGNRVSSIIKSMLQHSRFSKQEKDVTDINKFVEDFVNIAATGRKSASIHFDFDMQYSLHENIPEIKIVQQDLGRVLINIFNNAFDAILERSTIENGTYKPKIHISTGIENNFVVIDISDNGKGIPENIKKKIFEPFFTTKQTGAGTGLGLSITNEILISQGGMLRVISTPGEGSTFRIMLPV